MPSILVQITEVMLMAAIACATALLSQETALQCNSCARIAHIWYRTIVKAFLSQVI